MITDAKVLRSARLRNDLLDEHSPEGIRVTQLVNEPGRYFRHLYMEVPKFTPDGQRLIVQEWLNAQESGGPDSRDVLRRYYLCVLGDTRDISLRCLTDHDGLARAAAVTPDGRYLYFIVSQQESKIAAFYRCDLETARNEKLFQIDEEIGDGLLPWHLYDLGTVSSDGKRYATACRFDEGPTGTLWGILVVDLSTMTVQPVVLGPEFSNVHPQYSRSPAAPRDIMIQHNHRLSPEATQTARRLKRGSGADADVHLIQDDGTNWRGFPWGRDGKEYCSGHQAWRGTQSSAVTSTGRLDTTDICQELVESLPVRQPEGGDHRGLRQDGIRNILSRLSDRPRFSHFGFDLSGNRVISDCRPDEETGVDEIMLGAIPPGGFDRATRFTRLMSSHNNWTKGPHAHPHPFLSPDGKRGFFNSNEGSAVMGIFMLENLVYIEA